MNYDEFAFFNRQLAAMLHDGIPLEGALKQLSADMQSGVLRQELELLGESLSKGTPLKDATAQRKLPIFYKKMLEIGVRANDLPGTLTLLADYYHRANVLWTRLKGLLVYPMIVIVVSLGLTLMLCLSFNHFLKNLFEQFLVSRPLLATAWIPPILLALMLILGMCALLIPSWRERLRWRIPGFREASLAQLASAMALMLRNGATLPEALAMGEMLEADTAAGHALATWRGLIEGGQGNLARLPVIRPFPPLFVWLLQKSPEHPAVGFGKAAELYGARASYRIELALYGALPVSVLLLGQMILWQVVPMLRTLIVFMNSLGDTGG